MKSLIKLFTKKKTKKERDVVTLEYETTESASTKSQTPSSTSSSSAPPPLPPPNNTIPQSPSLSKDRPSPKDSAKAKEREKKEKEKKEVKDAKEKEKEKETQKRWSTDLKGDSAKKKEKEASKEKEKSNSKEKEKETKSIDPLKIRARHDSGGKKEKEKEKEKDRGMRTVLSATALDTYTASTDDYTLVKMLGKGAYGTVSLVRKKENGKLYAMKAIPKRTVLDQGRVDYLFSERNVLRKTKHPFIVRLYCTFQTKDTLFFVMKYFPGGDIEHYLKQSETSRFSEQTVRIVAAEIYLALATLHQHNTIYRDLKPENILLDSDGHVALSDFGLAKDFGETTGDNRASSFVGSPFYVAPEVLQGRKYSTAVDWWSYGVLLYRLLTGTTPFKGKTYREVFSAIATQPHSISQYPYITKEGQDLVNCLLQKSETSRIDCARIRTHAFFKGIDWKEVERKGYATGIRVSVDPIATGPEKGRPLDFTHGSEMGAADGTIGTPQQKLFSGFSYNVGGTPTSRTDEFLPIM